MWSRHEIGDASAAFRDQGGHQSDAIGLKKGLDLITGPKHPINEFAPSPNQHTECQAKHYGNAKSKLALWITLEQGPRGSGNHPGISNRKRLLLNGFHVALQEIVVQGLIAFRVTLQFAERYLSLVIDLRLGYGLAKLLLDAVFAIA